MTAITPFEFPATGQQVPEVGPSIYVIGFGSGIVKVGYTAKPRARFQQHDRAARQMGDEITRAWLSGVHANARDNESTLIAYCASAGRRTTGGRTGEFFTGIDFDDVCRYAQSLPTKPMPDSDESVAHADRCPACALVDDRPLTALSLLHHVANGDLRIVDSDGLDVSREWAGVNGLLPCEQLALYAGGL